MENVQIKLFAGVTIPCGGLSSNDLHILLYLKAQSSESDTKDQDK